jgi:hypothetical protein
MLKNVVSTYIPFAGMWFWAGHFFAPDTIANSIGWPKGSPFQQEVAFANLSFAIAAFYVSNTSVDPSAFKAIAVAYVSWLSGCLYVHVTDIIKNKNYSVNNAFAAPLTALVTISVLVYLVKTEH